MRVAFVILGLYLLLPFAGLYTVTDIHMKIYGFSYRTLNEIIQVYPLFVVTYFFTLIAALYSVKSKRAIFTGEFTPKQISTIRTRITIVLLVILTLAFFVTGKDIISGTATRGDIRVSLGGLGFVFKTLTLYISPVALAISGALYKLSKERGVNLRFPFLHVFLTIAVAAMLGYKSAVIVAILPFAIILSSTVQFRLQILSGFALIGLLVVYSSIVLQTSDLFLTLDYLMLRGTSGTAWGLIASWEVADFTDVSRFFGLLPIFGPKITGALLGLEPNTAASLQLSSAKFVSYLVHPNPELVLEGKTNLTITLVGESVYLLGKKWFWIIAIPVGLISGVILGLLSNKLRANNVIAASLYAIVFVNIILPVINSGGIVGLYSAFNLFYVLVTFFFAFLLCKTIGQRPPHSLQL